MTWVYYAWLFIAFWIGFGTAKGYYKKEIIIRGD